jgi:hypothetical protein
MSGPAAGLAVPAGPGLAVAVEGVEEAEGIEGSAEGGAAAGGADVPRLQAARDVPAAAAPAKPSSALREGRAVEDSASAA